MSCNVFGDWSVAAAGTPAGTGAPGYNAGAGFAGKPFGA
jgi:hypothetical protein